MGINDLAWGGGEGYSYSGLKGALAARGADSLEWLSAFKNTCKEYSQICRRAVLAKWRLGLMIGKTTGRALEWHSKHLPELRKQRQQLPEFAGGERDPDPIVEFNDAMSALVSMLRAAGIEVLVLGQPVLWKKEMTSFELENLWFPLNTPKGRMKPTSEWMLNEMQRFNEVQERIALRHGGQYLDLDSTIPKTLENYFDDCHFTDKGSQLVASVVAPALTERVRSIVSE